MKRPPNPFFAVMFVIFTVGFATASTTVYVSQSGGTFGGGSACSGKTTISIATFNSGSESAGNTYYFCGAITTPPIINGSGTSANVITFLWDTGARISVAAGQIINLNGSTAYLLFDGGIACGLGTICDSVEVANQTGYAAGQAGIIEATANGSSLANQNTQTQAFWGCNGCHDIEIRNLIIRNLYQHTSASDTTGSADTGDFIFQCPGGNSGCAQGTISIHDITVHDVGNAVSIQKTSTTTVNVYNIDFYHMNWAMENSGNGTRTLSFHDSGCHDASNWDTGSSDAFHHNCLHNYMNVPSDSLALNFYNNYSYGNWGTCCTTDTLIYTEVDLPDNFNVFNNVDIQACDGENAPSMQIGATTGVFANNSLLGCSTQNPNVEAFEVASGTSQTFENNAIQGYGQHLVADGTASAFAALDYNTYGPIGRSGNGAWVCDHTNNYSSFAPWRASACSPDAHGQNVASLGVNSLGVPQSGSVLIGAGTSLYSTCHGAANPGLGALCSDSSVGNTRTPVARPSSGAWDGGAYEYQAPAASQGTALQGSTKFKGSIIVK